MERTDFEAMCDGRGSLSKFQIFGEDFESKLIALQEDASDSRIHDHQVQAVRKTNGMLLVDEGLRQGGKANGIEPAIIVAPTGSGKSGMITMLPYILKAKKVLIITPAKVISRQIAIDFGMNRNEKSFFEKTGLYSKERVYEVLEVPLLVETKLDPVRQPPNLVIINAQKFGGESKTSLLHKDTKIVDDVKTFFPHFDLLIVDEAHHYPARTWEKIVQEFGIPAPGLKKKIVFLTATPNRKEANGVVPIVPNLKDRTAFKISVNELVDLGLIRRAEFKELSESNQVGQNIFQCLTEQNKIETRFHHQAMVIVRTKEEAKEIRDKLNSEFGPNFSAAIISDSEAEQLTEKFTNGDYRVAVVCGKLMEGYDNPKVSLCVILRPIGSQVLFTQFIGRCVRVKRDIPGTLPDQTTSVVLSYPEFAQGEMWNAREEAANEDPVDEDE